MRPVTVLHLLPVLGLMLMLCFLIYTLFPKPPDDPLLYYKHHSEVSGPAARVAATVPELYDGYCETLFTSARLKLYDFTREYRTRINNFTAKVASIAEATNEGSSGSLRQQSLMLHYLAQGPDVKTVCETGFNVGYSSLNYLAANPNVTVYSFDIGAHRGTRQMAGYLTGIYGQRLQVVFGDSTRTLPAFSARNPQIKCDVIFVDGGHAGKVPWLDVQNLARMAVPGRSLVVFDDYPAAWGMRRPGHPEMGGAWELALHRDAVHEVLRCTSRLFLNEKYERGFCVGVVLNTLI